MKNQFLLSITVFLFLATLNFKSANAVPGTITVCESGCNYNTLQAAANASTSNTKIIVTGNLSGAAASLDTSSIIQNLNIQCNNGVELNATGASVLLQGSNMNRSLTLTGCTLKGATTYLIDMSTTKTLTFNKNVFYDAPVKTNTNTSAYYDSNAFINSKLLQGLGFVSIVNNTFSSTTNNTTAMRLAPTGNPEILHNTIKGYALGIDFFTPKSYMVYNNIISETNQAFQIPAGAMIDTNNTVLHVVGLVRNGNGDNGTDFVKIFGNPNFIDSALHIDPINSVAMGAGSYVKSVKYDKDGNVRTDSVPDIGAYEVTNQL